MQRLLCLQICCDRRVYYATFEVRTCEPATLPETIDPAQYCAGHPARIHRCSHDYHGLLRTATARQPSCKLPSNSSLINHCSPEQAVQLVQQGIYRHASSSPRTSAAIISYSSHANHTRTRARSA